MPTSDTDEPPRHLEAMPDPPPDPQYDRTPPNDLPAEQAVLGAMLLSTQAITDTLAVLYGTEFYRPAHELIYHTILDLHIDGTPVDVVTVNATLEQRGESARTGGAPYLHDLITNVASPAAAPYYAHIIRDRAARRRLTEAGTRITELGYATTGADFTTLHSHAQTELEHAAADHNATTQHTHAPDIDEFLTTDDTEYEWVIPDVLERQDRLVVTASEGAGKSTLLRQIAVQAAAGTHPFTLKPMPPLRVLLVDLENSDRQNRRKLRPLRAAAGDLIDDPDRLHIISKLDGLDLTQACDERWLSDLIAAHTPDIVITGPIYKLAGGNPNDEKDAKPASTALDRLRAAHGCALILEAHSRKAENGDPKKRPKEPYGWSGWMRWPEFGIHLGDDGALTHWRGMRDERTFPPALNRGGSWPWTPDAAATAGDTEMRWHQIKRCIWQAGHKLSEREISTQTGISRSTVQRVLGAYAMEHVALLGELSRDDR